MAVAESTDPFDKTLDALEAAIPDSHRDFMTLPTKDKRYVQLSFPKKGEGKGEGDIVWLLFPINQTHQVPDTHG